MTEAEIHSDISAFLLVFSSLFFMLKTRRIIMEFSEKTARLIDGLYHKRSHVELTVGILKNGGTEIVHFNPEHKEDGNTGMIYAAGSICKTFTCSLFAKMITEGKLNPDAPLSDYIEGLPQGYYPSLRRLATHTSGYGGLPFTTLQSIPMFMKMNEENGLLHVNPFRGYPDEEGMMKIIRETKLKNKIYPFEYSNIGMSILGYIIGKTDGRGFWDAMNSYVKDELHLPDTFLGNIDMTGYDKKDQPCECWKWEKDDIIAPAGAMNSTAEDLLKFAQMNLDGSLPYVYLCHQFNAPLDKNNDTGLGWRLYKKQPVSWHTGSAGAFSCWLGFDRMKKTAVTVEINYGLVNAEEIGFSIIENL